MAIGFVIWGLRYNDFSNDLLSAGAVHDVTSVLSDQMRQVCATQQRAFLSAERSTGHVLVSIFKPDALDHVGRRAYIGITVFVPHGYRLQARNGTVPEAMHKLLAYYEEKQGRVVERNQFTAGMFQAQVDGLLQAFPGHTRQQRGDKRGYAVYNPQQEGNWFQGMDLADYRRVFFFREKPDLETAGLTGYEPFDPNKKVEEVRAEEHVNASRMDQRRRRAGRRKHTGWIIAAVLGLSLLVVGGGAWWVLHEGQTTEIPIQVPAISDTSTSAAPPPAVSVIQAEPPPTVAPSPINSVPTSRPKSQIGSISGGKPDEGSASDELCAEWCKEDKQKMSMDEAKLKDHQGNKPDGCRCKE